MGGRITLHDGQLIRFGQNNSRGYGAGLTMSYITKLTPTVYSENKFGDIRIDNASGPHTLDIHKDKMVLDFYTNKFSVLAGYRRIAAYLRH